MAAWQPGPNDVRLRHGDRVRIDVDARGQPRAQEISRVPDRRAGALQPRGTERFERRLHQGHRSRAVVDRGREIVLVDGHWALR